jgi:lysosomal acid lipase/cholesteryl ester hydrolase
MADGLLGLAAGSFWFWFCVLVLAAQPQRAHGLNRGSFGQNNGVVAPPEAGICASSVTVYGYKCQELQVPN